MGKTNPYKILVRKLLGKCPSEVGYKNEWCLELAQRHVHYHNEPSGSAMSVLVGWLVGWVGLGWVGFGLVWFGWLVGLITLGLSEWYKFVELSILM
jgi:hypothetical protein